jgi:two-component system OmpR family sensor kinase
MTARARGRPVAAVRRLGERLRRLVARSPLRVRLVAILLVLVAAALVGSGVAAAATMRSYLVGRVDSQLKSVPSDPHDHDGDIDRHGAPDTGADEDRRLPSAFVIEEVNASGAVVLGPTSNLVDSEEPLPKLPTLTAAQASSGDTRLITVDAAGGSDAWRVLIRPTTLPDGTRGAQLVAQSLGDVDRTVDQLTMLLLIIGGVAIVVLAGVGYLVVRASLRPLGEVERTAAAIAGGDLSQRVPAIDPRTEVGQLSTALNTMLAEIELAFAERAASESAARHSEERMRQSELAARRSEERMRRFVADASHELRTPLTTIRGFAELYRQGAVTDAQELARAMRHIEEEAARMGLLVEDLLLLARLDQERPLAQVPVDLLPVAVEAVAGVRAADPAREIRLEIGRTDPPPIVIGDEPRLRQILANLLANAVKHTPPVTPVTVTLHTECAAADGTGRVVLVVADKGPGMSTEHAARVFERFYRADAARSRADGGAGLGLAIVAALVAGHAGVITVETAPGRGASFRVELPLAAVPVDARTD